MTEEAFPGGLTSPMEWLDGILPRTPHVSPDFVKFQILSTLRDFFQRSGAWRGWLDPFNLDPEHAYYSLELTDVKAECVAILAGYRTSDEQRLGYAQKSIDRTEQAINKTGSPAFFFRTTEGLACIFPKVTPGVTESVKLFVSMKPIDLCVPDWIRQKHFDAIVDGTLARIYKSPGINKDLQLAAIMQRQYRAAIGEATRDALADGTSAQYIIQPPRQVFGSQRGFAGRKTDIAIEGTSW